MFDKGSVSVLILDLKILCIFSVMADIPSCRIGKMKTLKEERLAVSREPQTMSPNMWVQTLLWSNLWLNLGEGCIQLSKHELKEVDGDCFCLNCIS